MRPLPLRLKAVNLSVESMAARSASASGPISLSLSFRSLSIVPVLALIAFARSMAPSVLNLFSFSNGMLADDPRRTGWRTVLLPHIPSSIDSLVADESPVSEVLNAAYAMHEFTDMHIDALLDWLDACRQR